MNKIIPKLPSYADSENNVFHPAFEYALQEALDRKNLQHIVIKKQYPSPTGPIDLVLFNTITSKVVTPIEIKRTKSNVKGGGRRQARDYWQNLGNKCESPFYCVSNLELTELFRSDQTKPKTSSQQIKLDNPIIGNLDSGISTDKFYSLLISSLENVLDIIFGHKPYMYSTGLSELQNNLESVTNNWNEWHKIIAPAFYEYIRGASCTIKNLSQYNWKPAKFFMKTPNRLLEFGRSIDFEHAFKDPIPPKDDAEIFATSVLSQAYNAGKELGSGDDIAELINEILADYTPKKDGIVETDVELAQILAIIAKITLGRTLTKGETILDPASGSGRLLTIIENIAFPEITPKQIKAIEKEPLFSEALSLRLGLAFSTTISTSNSPNVLITGIEDVDLKFFQNVKVVLMNPPYISGVKSSILKKIFSQRIKQISGETSQLNVGQAALELLFLELVYHLVPDNTIISVIFPSNHLYRSSKEMAVFRQFLLEKFGLKYIAIYPRNGLFTSVTKGTVILSGQKSKKSDTIELIEIWENISDIQFYDLYHSLLNNNSFGSAQLTSLATQDLLEKCSAGWQEVLGVGKKSQSFIDSYTSNFLNLGDLKPTRGSFGNKGGNDLTVINKNKPKYQTIFENIPKSWLRNLLNTTEHMSRNLSDKCQEQSFLIPQNAYLSTDPNFHYLEKIISEYLQLYKPKTGTQKTHTLNKDKLIDILKSNNKTYSNLVLLPRASRAKADIGIIKDDHIMISTNVLLIKLQNKEELELMGSWLLSVFGQLQLELHSVSQEGMRKLEVSTLKKIKYPDFSKINTIYKSRIKENFYIEEPIIFSNLNKREIDILWSEILFNTEDSQSKLHETFNIFQELVDNRIGLG